MVAPISSISATSRGLCPHGLPYAACPICSKMMGAGGGSVGGSSGSSAKEMTWDECYAAGQRLKAEAQRAEDAKKYNAETLAVALQGNKTYQALAAKASIFASFLQTNFIRPVTTFVNNVFTTITRPIVALADMIMNSSVANVMKAVASNIQKGFANISDKIAAVLGEPFVAAGHVVAEFWRKIKPKKFIFFSAVDTEMEQGEQEEEVELRRWLHLKSLKRRIDKIFKKTPKKGRIEW